eukprot:1172554-Pleurochrysis_carterae.AAC.1
MSRATPRWPGHRSPHRRTVWFMTPLSGKAEKGTCAALVAGAFTAPTMLGVVVAFDSASQECRQSALPEESSVKGMSPPSCKKSALSAESDTGV